MKAKWLREGAAWMLAAAVTVTSVFSGGVTAYADTASQEDAFAAVTATQELTGDQVSELLQGQGLTRERASVHDPSIVKEGDKYYVYGSHMGIAETTDLQNWKSLGGENAKESQMFGIMENGQVTPASFEVAFQKNEFTGEISTVINGETKKINFRTFDASAWIKNDTYNPANGHEVSGNMWAPDVIQNKENGKWMMYLSLNGEDWNSAIILLTADEVTGPYVYQGPVVFTGFTPATYKDTDLSYVYGDLTELPEKYDVITNKANDHKWGEWFPHAIDPNVFYDANGKLWMDYGSWSGGICLLELDETTGLRDYTVTYADDVAAKGQSWTSDPYFGKRIAGGYYVSGEGPYIEKIGDYYYLFLSYGFYSPDGGYVMRIFRSETPDGEYVDQAGNKALYQAYELNYGTANGRGDQLMSSYKWDDMEIAETAQGHNSVLVDNDGKIYVIYHTKITDGTAAHQLRVHQLFVNEKGWLVAAPYEYGGETIASSYADHDIVGEYNVILHSETLKYKELEYVSPVQLKLEEGGAVSGAKTGTWRVSGNDITLTLEGTEYYGKLIEQQADHANDKTLCFTVMNQAGLSVWGSKIRSDQYALAQNVVKIDQTKLGVPTSTYGQNLSLATNGTSGVKIAWKSSRPEVISHTGAVTPVAEDTNVTLTARFYKGAYYYDKTLSVMVKAGTGTFTEETLIAEYFTDAPQNLADKLNGSLKVANPYNKTTNIGLDASGGVRISFDVTRTGEVHVLGTILAFLGGGKLYFTPGSYLGYNAAGGYFDANLKSYGLVNDYIGEKGNVSILLKRDGFEVSVNGDKVYDESILKTENGAATLIRYKKVLEWLQNSATEICFGAGSWWDQEVANNTISNVKCYVEPTVQPTIQTKGYEKELVEITSADFMEEIDNPFYGIVSDSLTMEYTINFATNAAKNGWDGIFAFYEPVKGGRVSMSTNPYVCYNNADGSNMDINSPAFDAKYTGSTWAANAERGKDYHVVVTLNSKGCVMSVDGKTLTTGENSTDADYDTVLDYVAKCTKLTLGTGPDAAGSCYWGTEICTLKDLKFSITTETKNLDVKIPEESPVEQPVEKVDPMDTSALTTYYTKDEVKLETSDALQTEENPYKGMNLERAYIAYTINFKEGTAKNGWDGIFSFNKQENNARISFQTNPFVSYNAMLPNENNVWKDINGPGTENATKWAPTAEFGKDYRIEILITKDQIEMIADGIRITPPEAGVGDVSYENLLTFLSSCEELNFGVGKAAKAFWNTEICTLKDVVFAGVSDKDAEYQKPAEDETTEPEKKDETAEQENPEKKDETVTPEESEKKDETAEQENPEKKDETVTPEESEKKDETATGTVRRPTYTPSTGSASAAAGTSDANQSESAADQNTQTESKEAGQTTETAGKTEESAQTPGDGSADTSQNTTADPVGSDDQSPAETVTKAKNEYTVSESGKKEVTFEGTKDTGSVKVPATIKVDGKTYKVTEIAKAAFKNNDQITKVTIGKNVEKIGAGAFQNCDNLKTVTISGKVTTIQKNAFKGCENLKTIKITSTKLTSVDKNAFKGVNKNTVIEVPKSKLKAYKKLLKKAGLNKKVKIVASK